MNRHRPPPQGLQHRPHPLRPIRRHGARSADFLAATLTPNARWHSPPRRMACAPCPRRCTSLSTQHSALSTAERPIPLPRPLPPPPPPLIPHHPDPPPHMPAHRNPPRPLPRRASHCNPSALIPPRKPLHRRGHRNADFILLRLRPHKIGR